MYLGWLGRILITLLDMRLKNQQLHDISSDASVAQLDSQCSGELLGGLGINGPGWAGASALTQRLGLALAAQPTLSSGTREPEPHPKQEHSDASGELGPHKQKVQETASKEPEAKLGDGI